MTTQWHYTACAGRPASEAAGPGSKNGTRMTDARGRIAGAGIARLPLAKALRPRDIATEVAERAGDWSAVMAHDVRRRR